MKKILAVALLVAMAIITLTGCGNQGGFGSYTFNRVHIFTHDGHDRCLKVERWYESNTGIEVLTEEYGSLFLSEGTYMLCRDKCPICDN